MDKKLSFFYRSITLMAGVVVIVTFFCSVAISAAELQGAASIIEKVKSVIDSENETATPIADKRLALVREMEQFDKAKGAMTKLEAARKWVLLAERFLQLPQLNPIQIKASDLDEFKLLLKTASIKSLFSTIPGPDSWPEITVLCREKIVGEKDAPAGFKSILMFMHLLNRDIDTLLSEFDEFENSALEQAKYDKEQVRLWFSQIRDEIKKHDPANTTSGVVEAFDRVLSSFESFATQPAVVRAPDLLKETDREQTVTLLKRALSTPTIYLEIPSGEETRKLGAEVALSEIDRLQRPQWGLVNSIDRVELFEKLYDKFERSKVSTDKDYAKMVSRSRAIAFEGENDLKKQAIAYYVLGLLSENRVNEAKDFTLGLEDELISVSHFTSSLKATERADLFPVYSTYLDSILTQKPELPFWKQYVEISLVSDTADALHNTLTTVLERDDITFPARQQIKNHLITVLLAQDRIAEALQIYKDIEATEIGGQSRKNRYEFANLKYTLGSKLYDLGRVINRIDLEDWGVSMATAAYHGLLENQEPGGGYFSTYKLGKIISILLEREEFSAAEKLIAESTLKQIVAARKGSLDSLEILKYSLAEIFSELAKLYEKAGKHAEIVTLLDTSPWWNVADLIGLQDKELLLVAAKALHMSGDDNKALDILKSYLIKESNDDEAYRLFVEIAGSDSISWLEKLYEMDRFEERPLMWKAYLLYKSGEYDRAEKVIRQAMSVDPTDGEQKSGQRVHSYSILADILAAKGDKENATFFRDVVSSVRIAEEGDLLSKAGLVARSIDYYQDAMAVFADAYCIQWRLAERLYATGDLEGSKEHYRIAFERMPEQFGQVASFCFGCEGAFDKMQSRSAAEEVFSHLLETTPDRPQVYFLYGLLRKSQKRIPEAYGYFKKAVELDPDYLDAWKEISQLSESVYLSREEKDRIVIKMLTLDPQQKHFSADISDVVDWVGLWNTLEHNQRLFMKQPETLYPLRESARILNAEREKMKDSDSSEYYFRQMRNDYDREKTMNPSELLSQHNMISTLDYLISLEKLQ